MGKLLAYLKDKDPGIYYDQIFVSDGTTPKDFTKGFWGIGRYLYRFESVWVSYDGKKR